VLSPAAHFHVRHVEAHAAHVDSSGGFILVEQMNEPNIIWLGPKQNIIRHLQMQSSVIQKLCVKRIVVFFFHYIF
jgi:hypothetical protein